MNFCIKNSFKIIADNPHIMLLLVTYLLAFSGLLSAGIFFAGKPVFTVMLVLIFLLTCAFIAGWLGMIKYLLLSEETDNQEEILKNKYKSFSIGFFSSVANYILPVLFFIVLFIFFIKGIISLTDTVFNGSQELFGQIGTLIGDKDALYNYISTLPEDKLIAVIKINLFIYSCILSYLLLTFYAIPATFFNEKSSNPLLGLKNGLIAFFKKPLQTLGLFLFLLLIHTILVFFEGISVINQILMFIALVLRVSFITYIVVLIFSVYEKNFAHNCNNGSDGVGENKSCN